MLVAIVLPSFRLALYQTISRKITITSINTRKNMLHSNGCITTLNSKSIQTYTPIKIQDRFSLKLINESGFSKKIADFCLGVKDRIIATDKFGDIYQLNHNKEQNKEGIDQITYLNSNLGIPTLIQCVDERYLIVCDQDTKLKVYNMNNMHEIISLWFLQGRTSVQLLQTAKDKILLALQFNPQTKYSEQNANQWLYQVHSLQIQDLQNQSFKPNLIYSSPIQCKERTIVSNNQNKAFLLQFTAQLVKGIPLVSGMQGFESQFQKGQWDYYSAVMTEHTIVISYGKGKEWSGEGGQPKLGQNERILIVQI